MKRILSCLLAVAMLLFAAPAALAETNRYDADGDSMVTVSDALIFLHANVGLVVLERENPHKLDPVIAYMIATNKLVGDTTPEALYNKGATDETVSLAVDFAEIEGVQEETFSLSVYVVAEDNPVMFLDVPEVVYDHTMLKLTGCVPADRTSMPLMAFNDDHFQVMYGASTNYEEIELQFTVLQDFAPGETVDISLQGASAIVGGTGLNDAIIATEAGEVSTAAATKEDLEMTISLAKLMADPFMFTEDSIAIVTAALDAAEQVLEDPDATPDDILNALNAINAAMEKLEPSEIEFSLGDVDGKDGVTAADALLTLQAATGKIELGLFQGRLADVDGDENGDITANDALLILQYATKKITSFPIEDLYEE